MVDLVLSLDATGHQRQDCRFVAARPDSARATPTSMPAPPIDRRAAGRPLRALFRWLRRRAAEVGWRAAIDSLRPHSHALWQSLTHDEQRRFLRHGRPWWDVHRHRIAPEVAATVAAMVARGAAGDCRRPDRLRSRARRGGHRGPLPPPRRAAESQSETFAYAFNCTGPLHSIARTRDPLLRSLLDAGQSRPDHLGIGLEVDGTLAAPASDLWAMGPLTKGRYWEIIAVPDIREQAAAVADDIERELGE